MTKDNINIYFRRVFNPNVKSIEYVQQARTQNECTDFEIFVQKKNGLNLKINGSVLIIRCDIFFKGELMVLKYLRRLWLFQGNIFIDCQGAAHTRSSRVQM